MRQKNEDGLMSSVATTAHELVLAAKARHFVKTPEARKIFAREIGVKPGALERLLAGRLVHVERIADRINAYVARRIERKIAELEHEVWLARMGSSRPDEVDLLRAETALAEARKALGR